MLDALMGKAGFISGSECRRASLEGVILNPPSILSSSPDAQTLLSGLSKTP